MDTQAVLDLMREVTAQVITPRFRALESDQVMEKNPGDLVTVADREAEVLITKALLDDDPDVLVVGEEATASDPGLPTRLAGADHAFTVDPVDGTRNFVHGSPNFAVMLSELRNAEVVRAWIYHPVTDVAYVGERGAGVWRDGERLAPLEAPQGAPVIATSTPEQAGRHGDLDLVNTAWSCGIDYPWLIDGRVHGLVYGRTQPWDHCPGSMFVEELGGVVRFRDGSRYSVVEDTRGRRGLFAAASADIWDAVAPHLPAGH